MGRDPVEAGIWGGCEGAQTALSIVERRAEQEREQARQSNVPEPHCCGHIASEVPASEHEVCLARKERGHHEWEIARTMLAVRVHHDEHVAAGGDNCLAASFERSPLTQVDGMADHAGALSARNVRGAVRGAVVHDHRHHWQAVHVRIEPGYYLAGAPGPV